MKEEMMQEVFIRLEALAAKLGVGVEFLWALGAKQAGIDVAKIVVFALLASIIAGVSFRAVLKESRRSYDDDMIVGLWIAVGALSCAAIETLFMAGGAVIDIVMNPEYATLKKLMEVVK